MNMRLPEQIVPLDHIDSEDITYRITTRSGTEDLTASIVELGILHAPILQPRGNRWIIVAGFRRITACREIRRSEIAAKLLPPETSEQRRIELAIADNSLQRPLNLIETARSLEMLSRCHGSTKQLIKAAVRLNLPGSPDHVSKLLRLATFSPTIQDAVRDEVITLSMALTLADLEEPIADEWVRIFRDLNPGLNRQRELMTLVSEIAFREEKSAASVLFDTSIRQVLSPASGDADPAQKYRMLAANLRQRRFPHLTRAARRWDELVQSLPLGPHAQLTPPAHFEGTAYQLRLLFRSLDELERHLQTVEKLLQHPAFKDFLE